MKRKELVNQGRTWIGTPFHHQGRLKGIGVDCLGFLVGLAKEMELLYICNEDKNNYTRKNGYDDLVPGMQRVLQKIKYEEVTEGDVLLFAFFEHPQHLALKSDGNKMIHAVDKYGVVEVDIDEVWQKRLISAWRLPDLED